jgi:hypothetical protein
MMIKSASSNHQLDQQLVQGLVVLAVVGAARAGGADSVRLVDEDDRGLVLARLREQTADPRQPTPRTSPRTRGALEVELAPDSVAWPCHQGLAGAGRPVQQHAAWARARFLNRGIAQELDDLLQPSRASSAPATSCQRTEWPLAGWILFGLVVGIARHILYAKKTRAKKQAGSTNGQSSNNSHVPKP